VGVVEHTPATLAVAHDAPVVHLDPGGEVVGEAEPVVVPERREVVRIDVVRRSGVVVADLQLEGQLGDPADGLRGDPRDRRDR
jgi:hypothetical protein